MRIQILARIERAERAAKAQSKFDPACICFPENEPPFFHWPIELNIAADLECPLHGARFRPERLIYVSKWLRRKREFVLANRRSKQFLTAWFASFPTELWPADEEQTKDGTIFLRLKDGNRYLACEPDWKHRATKLPRPSSAAGLCTEKS